MTEDDFQTTIFQFLQELGKKMGRFEDFAQEQRDFNEKIRSFIKEQRDFNKRLWVAVENDIHDQVSAHSDDMKSYTDRKIRRHEKQLHHISAV